jgi:hypothetical protein
MAANRCFDSFNATANLSARDRSLQKRDTTIYNELRRNIQQFHTANPTKKNGFKYNQTSIVNPTCDISNGDVANTSSYDLKTSIKNGAELIYPVEVSTPKYQSWCGNLYSINYLQHNVKNVVQTDASFTNIIIDPSYILFYSDCDITYENTNSPATWTNVVDLSFQSTFYAKQADNTANPC